MSASEGEGRLKVLVRSRRQRESRRLMIAVKTLVELAAVVVHVYAGRDRTPPLLHVLSVTPRSAARNVEWSTTIAISYARPLTQPSGLPSISPSVSARWTWYATRSVVFHPRVFFTPGATHTVTIPDNGHGVTTSTGHGVQIRRIESPLRGRTDHQEVVRAARDVATPKATEEVDE